MSNSRRFAKGRSKGNTSQIKKNSRAIARMNDAIELKQIKFDIALQNTGGNRISVLLNGVVHGTTDEQRLGTEVTGHSVHINLQLKNTVVAQTIARVMLIRYIQVNGAIFDFNDLFQNAGGAETSTAGLLEHSHKQKFVVYYDKVHRFATQNDNSDTLKFIKIRQRLGGLKTHYRPGIAGANVDTIDTNALYLVIQTTAGAANDIQYGYSTRYLFADS